MQNTISTKAMVEGALLAVITAILALLGTFIPLASFFVFLVVAVPIIIMVVRNNLASGIVASVVAAFLVGVIAGPIFAILFYIQFMLMALVYGYMFKNKKGAGKILVYGTFIAVISTILIITISLLVGQMNLQEQKEALYNTVDRTIQIYEDYGMMEQFEKQGINKKQLKEMLTGMITLFLRLLPSMLIIGSIFSAITHFIMAKAVLKRLGYFTPGFPPFSEWRLPWYAVWGFIAGWVSFLIGDIYKMNFWTILGQNIMIVYSVVLLVLGLSVISFFIKKFKFSRLTKLLILLLAVSMLQIAIFVTVIIGLFDLVLDHRKLGKKHETS